VLRSSSQDHRSYASHLACGERLKVHQGHGADTLISTYHRVTTVDMGPAHSALTAMTALCDSLFAVTEEFDLDSYQTYGAA
jgi:hypothetical protein